MELSDMIETILNVGFFVFLLLMGLIVGRTVERRHFRNLDERSAALADMLVTDLRTYPAADPARPGAELLVAEAVIGSDYLKTFLAGLRNIFGGEVKSFQTLLNRARREAILRVMEEAKARGYNALGNIRLDSADIGGNAAGGRNRVPMACILASATAYHALVTSPP